MKLRDIVDKFKLSKTPEGEEGEGEEFMEVTEDAGNEKISVRLESLKDYIDTDRVQQLVREGNVVFLRIKELRQKDITELKRAVDKLKRTCIAMDGDIVGVDEDFLVITPKAAKIFRGKAG